VVDEGQVDVAEEVVADVHVAAEGRVEGRQQHGALPEGSEDPLEHLASAFRLCRGDRVVGEDELGAPQRVTEGRVRLRVEQAGTDAFEHVFLASGHAPIMLRRAGGNRARLRRVGVRVTLALSVLDLVPVRSNQSSADAVAASLSLAQRADELGFTRYWFA